MDMGIEAKRLYRRWGQCKIADLDDDIGSTNEEYFNIPDNFNDLLYYPLNRIPCGCAFCTVLKMQLQREYFNRLSIIRYSNNAIPLPIKISVRVALHSAVPGQPILHNACIAFSPPKL